MTPRPWLRNLLASRTPRRAPDGSRKAPARCWPALPHTKADRTFGSADRFLATLVEAATALDAREEERARLLVRGLLRDTSLQGTAGERQAHLFALGLQARLEGDASQAGNLYRHSPSPGSMLAAFQVLVRQTPIVRFGYAAANAALAQALRDAPAIHLIDLGIGSGSQWPPLFDALAARPGGAPRVRLTGIDLPEAGGDSRWLQDVGQALQSRAAEAGLTLEFEGLAASMEDLDFARLRLRPGETVAVNAAFALHHVPAADAVTDPARSRDAVLTRLRALQPRLLTLVEPDVEHNALDFLPRVAESFRHYRTVYEALEMLLPRDSAERHTLETAFFGREIFNILAEGRQRVERHERRQAWRQRLLGQGFEAVDLNACVGRVRRELGVKPPYAVGVADRMLLLTWRCLPAIAASAWQPSGHHGRGGGRA